LETGNMRGPDVHNALLVAAPADSRLATHLSEDDINMLYLLAPETFEDAVCNRPPRVADREFYLDAKLTEHDVRETKGMRGKIYLSLELLQKVPNHFTDPVLEGLRLSVNPASRALSREPLA